MDKYGLIGFPLIHSFSKVFFTNMFSEKNIDAVYELYPLSSINEFKEVVYSNKNLRGLNVTIPYKQQVMSFIDELDPEAAQTGAVNVIKITRYDDGKSHLKGYNTDLIGFRESIRPLLNKLKSVETVNDNLKALVLGTGGASKAVIYGLKQLGVDVKLVSRKSGDGVLSYSELTPDIYFKHRVIVNTTPLGMFPEVDTCPDIDYSQISDRHLLYDVVYNPDNTLFLKKGSERGALVMNGLQMLHIQALEAWKIWNE
jgi:shikimate dehydrogenase